MLSGVIDSDSDSDFSDVLDIVSTTTSTYSFSSDRDFSLISTTFGLEIDLEDSLTSDDDVYEVLLLLLPVLDPLLVLDDEEDRDLLRLSNIVVEESFPLNKLVEEDLDTMVDDGDFLVDDLEVLVLVL